MAEIHILDSETIDKIAAGEVVERPSSVVKELVENAIDAGSTAVTVEAKRGGIEFIRVTDNGCGMAGGQLRRAFLRHATSKIESAEDLSGVSSLGFRGEALSSIAAVSKVEVITRTAENLIGCRILLEGAREVEFGEVGAPEGTTFLMRNLFFNTPVRRKFLKQPATEGGYISDLMEHLALSRPDISFRLILDGQMKFHTSGNGDLREVIYRIYGREVAGALAPINIQKDGIRVEGYLGKSVLVRSNRNYEIYFVNGRFIRSNVIARAVEEGYREYLMKHKFPLCVLHIAMEPGRVDVNVHPTKMDVRFSDPVGFSQFLAEAVGQTLGQMEMIPEASLSTEKELKQERAKERREQEGQPVPEPFERARDNAYRVMEEARYHSGRQGDFSKNPVWSRVKESHYTAEEEIAAEPGVSQKDTGMSEIGQSPIAAGDEPEGCASIRLANGAGALVGEHETRQGSPAEAVERGFPDSEKPGEAEEESFFEEISELLDDLSAENLLTETNGEAGSDGEGNPSGEVDPDGRENPMEEGCPVTEIPLQTQGEQLNLFEEKILTQDNRSRFRIIGQVFETYWLIEFEDKLLMIDQHAAHEKVNYERMMKRFREKEILSQGLLPPVIVSLSGQEEAVLKEHQDTFAALGFEIEAFGGSEYALRGVPVDLYGCDEREMFLEVLDSLLGGINFGSLRVIEEKIASASCKAAVKGNNRLSVAEAESLIDELLTLKNPYNCPHGRPTIITMTKMELEKKFKRIVN